jgi:hypothetical protein
MRTNARISCGLCISVIVAGATLPVMAQTKADALQLAELTSLKGKVGSADTRTRVDATHRVWSIGVTNGPSDVKLAALALLLEPVDSASDHIRMPAIYAIAEIAGTSADVAVKEAALNALAAPLRSEQMPARNAATDAVNGIVRSGRTSELAPAALRVLAPAVGSGTNGVRMPAINAVVRAVEGSQNAAAYNTALDLLLGPLGSNAITGGMEVRMMAIVAVERIGVDAQDVVTKAKAMGLAQSYVTRSSWEAEARKRASDAASAIQRTLK